MDNQEEIVAESIKHAKEAIALDVKDGNSWCKIYCLIIRNPQMSHKLYR